MGGAKVGAEAEGQRPSTSRLAENLGVWSGGRLHVEVAEVGRRVEVESVYGLRMMPLVTVFVAQVSGS